MRKKTTEELVSEKPLLKDFAKEKRNPLIVILNNVRSLQNVGLCFRICDALKVEKLYLTGFTGYPPLSKNDPRAANIILHAKNQIEKTAIRTVEYVPWEYQEDASLLIKKLKREGRQVVAIEQTNDSVNYLNAHFKFPLALVFGHEREGVEESLISLCDFSTEIQMSGMGNSLNVAITLAVIGYELLRKQLP